MAPDFSTATCVYPEDFFIHWKGDVVDVRQLYRERKYRRCAILCSQLLETAVSHIKLDLITF